MEELTKTQIVLLTLLVSFVTSIATGIVTVALVDQSSQGVGQTIQTVVEKTIETVIPSTKATSSDVIKVSTGGGSTPTVSESDLIVQAIAKSSPSLVRIQQLNSYPEMAFVGLGLIISKNGLVITDRNLASEVNAHYIAIFPDGKTAPLSVAAVNASTTSIGVFTVGTSTGEKLVTPVFGDSTKLSLGQKVIAISGTDKNTVNDGIISSFDNDSATTQTFIRPDFDVASLSYGSILINLNGEVVGIKVGKIGEDNEFLSSKNLKAELGI